MSSPQNKEHKEQGRRKPKKSSRSKMTEEEKSVPEGQKQKADEKYKDTVDPRQRLRDKIKQMQKDRARGSYACEENANHEY